MKLLKWLYGIGWAIALGVCIFEACYVTSVGENPGIWLALFGISVLVGSLGIVLATLLVGLINCHTRTRMRW